MNESSRPSSTPSMLVVGYFGDGNLGDDAILLAFIEWSRENLPGGRITVLSETPHETSREFRVETVGKTSWLRILHAVRSHDMVVFPGGGILQDATSFRSIVYYAGIAAAARLFRKSVFFLNQGVGPLGRSFSRKLAARVATHWAEEFTVRDETSAALLRDAGTPAELIEITADTSFLLKKTLSESTGEPLRPGEPLLIGISLRPHPTTEFFTGSLINAVKKTPGDKKLRLLHLQKGADEKITRKFAASCRNHDAGTPVYMGWGEDPTAHPTPHLALESLRKCHILIGMRLHSLIFSALCGVPFIGLSYDPKVRAFCDSLGQPCVEPGEKGAGETLAGEISRLAASHADFRKQLSDKAAYRIEALERFMSRFARAAVAAGGARVLGIPFSTMGFSEALAGIDRAVENRGSLHIVTLNPEMVMNARRDKTFAKTLRGADILTADGVGIRIAARAKYGLRLEKVAGIDLVERLLSGSRRKNQSLFFLGARPEVIGSFVEKLRASPDPPLVAGWHHGYFGESEEEEIIGRIREARPDVLLVGTGSPAQEKWIARNRSRLGVPVIIGVGGCFDVLSGTMPRAPAFFQKTGLEWLHRLAHQPGRIGRMAVLPRFLALALCDAFRNRIDI
ncbi:MAG: polysaccharide pyruvyl transferase CsaB [bacterium]